MGKLGKAVKSASKFKAPANKKVINQAANKAVMAVKSVGRAVAKGNGPVGRAVKRAAGKKTYKTGGEF